MKLPSRDPSDEDDFVNGFDGPADADRLIDAIEAAMNERRPHLAARLVALLDDDVAIEPGSVVDRARKAAHLLVIDTHDAELRWNELEEAFAEIRRRRMRRYRGRMRRLSRHDDPGRRR